MSNNNFYNPYHFVAINPQSKTREHDQDWQTIIEAKSSIRHDCWDTQIDDRGQSKFFSGRLKCELILETPTAVGASIEKSKHDKAPNIVCPYMNPSKPDEPAIPANSLRGMIGAVVETISQSNMRVLDNNSFTIKTGHYKNPKKATRTQYEFFGSQLPWSSSRDRLSPAEALFGVTESEGKRNIASRVRVTDATLDNHCNGQWCTKAILRELSLPKPPSPSMYFKNTSKDNLYVSKEELATISSDQVQPNGYKRYIPHTDQQVQKELWISQEAKISGVGNQRRNQVRPLQKTSAKSNRFSFSIQFENLSAAEYTLLKSALIPDGNPKFCHRLGMGKSLGLGMVRVQIKELKLMDPQARYNDLNTKRYSAQKEIPVDNSLVDDVSLQTLLTLGSRDAFDQGTPVQYPSALRDQSNLECEHFKWFVNNDKAAKQHQQALGSASEEVNIKTDGSIKPLSFN